MTIAIERILAWKLLPRGMMAMMCYAYMDVLHWSMTRPPEAMTSQVTALTATVTVAMRGAFAVWPGMKNDLYSLRSSSLKDVD